MRGYKALNKQIQSQGEFSIVPIRDEDKYDIMKWRNEQIFHLRQPEPLTKQKQERYFKDVVSKLFDEDNPKQYLFSFLRNDECIGYGGLVHINWENSTAEISFIIDTQLEKEHFHECWKNYLLLIERVAFEELKLHKIYTYAFDVRPHLFPAVEDAGFKFETRLKEHYRFDGVFVDAIIHSKFNRSIDLRVVNEADLDLTFSWAADPRVRKHSLNTSKILFEEHKSWFYKSLESSSCYYYIATYNTKDVGSFRLNITQPGEAWISYLLDPTFHGMGLGVELLKAGVKKAKGIPEVEYLKGVVLVGNKASIKAFQTCGFEKVSEYNGQITFQLLVK